MPVRAPLPAGHRRVPCRRAGPAGRRRGSCRGVHPHPTRGGPHRRRDLRGVDPTTRGRVGRRTRDRGQRPRSGQDLQADQGRGVPPSDRGGPRHRRHQLRPAAGPHPGHRRRVGVRQIHHTARDPGTHRPAVRFDRGAGQRRGDPEPGTPARAAPRPAGGLPGSGGLARSPATGLRIAGGAAERQRVRQGAHRGPGGRAVGDRGTEPRRREPLSGRVLRRPEAADRHRPRAGVAAQDPGPRRAGVRPGRVDPGRHHQPAAGPAEPVRPVVSVRLPRPVGGPAPGPPGRGDAPGAIVEYGDADEVFGNPQHEYTRTLLAAIPQPDPTRR